MATNFGTKIAINWLLCGR